MNVPITRREVVYGGCAVMLATGLGLDAACAQTVDIAELMQPSTLGDIAMGAESALTYFRRKPHKAVITGGDRTDIQLAALETSTRCLILTGNLYPPPVVLDRAEELGVPVLLSNLDTLSAVDIIDEYFGRSRFQQPAKVERFTALLEQNLDFPALYERLGLQPKN